MSVMTGQVQEGLDLHNAGESLSGWARRVWVQDVNDLARLVGVKVRATKDATVSAIERAPRLGVVEDGVRRLRERRGLRRWGKRARKPEVEELARRAGVDITASKAGTLANIEAGANRYRQLRRQAERLDQLRSTHTNGALNAFEVERLRFVDRLQELPTGDPYVRMRGRLREIDAYTRNLRRSLSRSMLRAARDITRQALTDLDAQHTLNRAAAEKSMEKRLALKLHEAAIEKLVLEIRDRLIRQAAVQPDVRRLAGRKSQLALFAKRLELTVKAETSRLYNDATILGADHIRTPRGAQVIKRIVEVVDTKNHPFSRAAINVTARAGEPFRVPAAEVDRWAAILRKSTGGIFWSSSRGHYVGHTLPAHYNDRGTIAVEVR